MEIDEYALKFINDHILKQMREKEEFRSRIRDLYSTAYFEGLIPTVTFAIAKATEEKVKDLYNGKNSLTKGEEGYGFFVLAILKFVKDYLNQNININIEELIKILRNKSIENKIFIYMRWLKYFAEAKIEAHQGE